MKDVHDDSGNVARAISDSTETLSLGTACMCTARYDTPMNSVIAIDPMTSSVRAAFLPVGGLNALTPFEIDSTPVRAAAPEANARKTMKIVTAPVPAASGSGTCACGQVAKVH